MDTLDTMGDSFESGNPQGINTTPEKAREKSEKQKESYSKALSGIGRSRKDEGKSQKQNILLAEVIQILLSDVYSEKILSVFISLSDIELPSFVLAPIVSITCPDAITHIVQSLHLASTFPTLVTRSQTIHFSQSDLSESEKTYINSWVELIFLVMQNEPSLVPVKRLLKILSSKRQGLTDAITDAITIFLARQNILATSDVKPYSSFILSEIEKGVHQMVFEDIDTGEKVRL